MDRASYLLPTLLILGCFFAFCPFRVAAEEPGKREMLTPFCSGRNPETGAWGMFDLGANPGNNCPQGNAVLFHSSLLGQQTDPEFRSVAASCCPLPPGALSEEHQFVSGACPDGWVITGGRMANASEMTSKGFVPRYEFRCTAIEQSRFRLGKSHRGTQLEFGSVNFLVAWIWPDTVENQTGWNLVPARLRYGLGRTSETEWTESGCLGRPWGSVLTEIGTQKCESIFRELIPLAGTRVVETAGDPIVDIGGVAKFSGS